MRLIEVLGPGCPRSKRTTAAVRAVVDRKQCDAEVRHVTDPDEIVARGALFLIPAVVVDGVLVSRGRVPTRKGIERWLDVGFGPWDATRPPRMPPQEARFTPVSQQPTRLDRSRHRQRYVVESADSVIGRATRQEIAATPPLRDVNPAGTGR